MISTCCQGMRDARFPLKVPTDAPTQTNSALTTFGGASVETFPSYGLGRSLHPLLAVPQVAEHLGLYSTVLPYGVWPMFAIEGLLIVGSPSLSPIDVVEGTPRHYSRVAYSYCLVDHFDCCLTGLGEGLICV